MAGRKGVNKGGSMPVAAGSSRALQQQGAVKQVQPPRDLGSSSAPGPARNQSGRFIRGGSKVEEVIPVPVKLLSLIHI